MTTDQATTARGEVERTGEPPTWKQLDVLCLAIERGGVTVREARDEVAPDLAYTSVLTILQTLEENDWVRAEREGKAHRYHPTVNFTGLGDEFARVLLAASPELAERVASAIVDRAGRGGRR